MSVFIGINKTTFSDPVNRRLIGGLLLSLLVHAVVLSMQFGIPGLGLPGFELPWKERRANLQPMTIQIANTQPVATEKPTLPIPFTPLAVVPVPLIPLLKPAPPLVASTGIRLVAPVVLAKSAPVLKKTITGKQKPIPAPPPTRLARPAVDLPDTPTQVIAQDQIRDDNFVVTVPDPEQPVRKSINEKSIKENAKPNVAETFDQTELSEAELAKSVELALAKEVEKENAEREKAEKILKQTRKLAEQIEQKQLEQKKVEQKKRELDLEIATQAIEKQVVAKKLEEDKQKQQAAKQLEDAAKQQEVTATLQKKLDAEEQIMRLQKQEAARLETQRIETQRRQDEQRKEQRLAQDLETRKQIEIEQKQQAAIQQKQLEEQVIKQKSEQLAARLKAEELATRKAAEQKLAEQTLAEQKLAEKKLAEQKLAEQKLAEQSAAEQRINEQRAAAQRERALADAVAASKANAAALSANANSNGNGNGSAHGGTGGTNFVLPKNNFSSDLANRAREQFKGLDLLSGVAPTPRQAGPDLPSRRRSILGNFDREVPLRMYVESWRQKVERNGNFNYSQSAKDKARGDPVVIVAIRSDGSVEDVTIVRSSGRADLDEAVGRIVRLNAPYSVFPQNIAAKYDVIEIRRVWRFDETLRILEEVR